MARARKKQEPTRGLSPWAVLAAIAVIDWTLDAFNETAPRAFKALGGRAGFQSRFDRMTVGQGENCVGILAPVPRLTIDEWQSISTEHVEAQRIVWDTWRGVGAAGERPGAETPSPAPTRARSFEVLR